MSAPMALVTGGATGIGAACARALAGAGFRVALHHRSSEEAARALQAELPDAFLVKADLAAEEGVEQVAQAVSAQPGPLAVLVNNAGMTADAPILLASVADFDRVMALNLRATWLLTKRVARLMARKKSGRIINISSVVGSTGNAYQSIYGMSKAAIDNLTRSLAAELAPQGILVNSVAPGFIETAMTEKLAPEVKAQILARIPLARMGTAEEVAEVVRFLATSASYCTGSVIHVNGGMYGG